MYLDGNLNLKSAETETSETEKMWLCRYQGKHMSFAKMNDHPL